MGWLGLAAVCRKDEVLGGRVVQAERYLRALTPAIPPTIILSLKRALAKGMHWSAERNGLGHSCPTAPRQDMSSYSDTGHWWIRLQLAHSFPLEGSNGAARCLKGDAADA